VGRRRGVRGFRNGTNRTDGTYPGRRTLRTGWILLRRSHFAGCQGCGYLCSTAVVDLAWASGGERRVKCGASPKYSALLALLPERMRVGGRVRWFRFAPPPATFGSPLWGSGLAALVDLLSETLGSMAKTPLLLPVRPPTTKENRNRNQGEIKRTGLAPATQLSSPNRESSIRRGGGEQKPE